MTRCTFPRLARLPSVALLAAAGLVALSSLPAHAAAPLECRAVHIVAPNPPGGATDVLSRVIGDPLSQRIGVPVIVDNKGGASTSIGNEFVARSAPDGCTLLLGNISMALNKSLMKLNYDVERDLRGVIQVAAVPLALFVNPKVDVKTVPELLAYAKAKPAEVNFSSAGPGTPTHLVVEMLNEREGTRIIHVPYRGAGPATMDVIGGLIVSSSDSLIAVAPYIRSGSLRALAVSGPRRSSILPDIPTFKEAGIGFADISLWYGVMAPSKTPDAVVLYLNKQISAVLSQPEIARRLLELGSDLPPDGTPQQFQALIHGETERLSELIRKANISLN